MSNVVGPGYATHEVLNQPGALARLQRLRPGSGSGRSNPGLRCRLGHRPPSRDRRRGRQRSRPKPRAPGEPPSARTAHPRPFRQPRRPGRLSSRLSRTHGADLSAPKRIRLRWTRDRPGAHVARGVLSYLWNQAENGICCPMGMTFASIPALRHDPALLAEWSPVINSPRYDPTAAYAKDKRGATVGMAMTEKQGGSDLRATITTARPASVRRGSGAPYLITGHKWFFSVPMSDLFLTLAQTEKGLSCFLATGWLPDGSRNRLKLQRLKDKCGNKSNASSEVEFFDLDAVMVGDEGRGIRDHHRNGACHTAGFCHWLVWPDAPGAQPGDAPHQQPPRLPAQPDRSADHAERRRRPRGGKRGLDVDVDAPRCRARSIGRQPEPRRCCRASARR